MCAMVERCSKCMLWCTIVGITQSADFDRATISIFYNEELHVWQQLLGRDGQSVITVSYSIGIVGTVCLWEAADPKDQNLCRNFLLYLPGLYMYMYVFNYNFLVLEGVASSIHSPLKLALGPPD